MIEFEEHRDCKLCSLWESAQNPGLMTRSLSIRGRAKAILFVGQSPGYHEDKKGMSFVGYTGQLLKKMVDSSKINDYADVFLANACRCKPPQGANESQGQIRACREYLIEDVQKLQEQYEEVIIFALGAKASYSAMNISSLSEALKKQAKFSPFFDNVRVFCTNHPAMLHPFRQPGKVKAVESHFILLRRYLQGDYIPNELKVEPEVLADIPENFPAEVTLDIETYGILKGVEQTVFHPIKSKEIDGVDFKYQIETVSFAWEDPEQGRVRTPLYMFKYKKHKQKIREWFRAISKNKSVCTGQNIKFDLLYLYFCQDREIPYWIDPRRLVVDDTMIWSFMYNEQQPEKGLKELSVLYGIFDYSDLKVLSKSGNAKSCHDKDLHILNATDCATTLCLKRDLKKMIADKYGEKSFKLSDACSWVRNMIIWDVFDLEANGSSFYVDKIKEYHKKESRVCKKLSDFAETKYGVKLHGEGSDAPLRQLMLDCLAEAHLTSDSRVEWSKKTGKISIGVENVNLIKQFIPRNSKNYSIISAFQQYKERSKIVSTYTKPLLENNRRGVVRYSESIGLVFPSWYPIPTYDERGGRSDDKAGGQIQGRFSCKQPARQTEPKSIRNCSCSRWADRGGKLVEYDVSQDHLRMAALLSGDPLLMEAYTKEGQSLHLNTASTIFPGIFCPDFKDKYPDKYKVSKNLNFLVLFRGGAEAFQREAREKVGIELEISFCQNAINKWYAKHHVYKDWQNQLIDLAARQGYLELPTGWSRYFGLGHANIAGQIGEVLNFIHQCPCAQISQSAHYKIKRTFLKNYLRSVVCLNIYDALFIDIYPAEEQAVHEIVGEAMTNPPLLKVFEDWTGRSVPWAWERKDYK